MTHDAFAAWLEAYVDAWKRYDPDAIGELFAPDAEYRYHPWGKPVRGRDAIVQDWLANRDQPGTYEAAYAPWAVEADRGVATGTSRYEDSRGRRTYHNVFLVTFDADGRCRSFTELFMEER
jgi:ketosteroid isomerase-like protein